MITFYLLSCFFRLSILLWDLGLSLTHRKNVSWMIGWNVYFGGKCFTLGIEKFLILFKMTDFVIINFVRYDGHKLTINQSEKNNVKFYPESEFWISICLYFICLLVLKYFLSRMVQTTIIPFAFLCFSSHGWAKKSKHQPTKNSKAWPRDSYVFVLFSILCIFQSQLAITSKHQPKKTWRGLNERQRSFYFISFAFFVLLFQSQLARTSKRQPKRIQRSLIRRQRSSTIGILHLFCP